MKIELSKSEAAAVVGARLLAAAHARQVAAVQAKIDALEKERDAMLAEVNAHANDVFDGIAEEHGVDEIPLRHAFSRLKDGTGTIEWEDGPERAGRTLKLAEKIAAATGMAEEQARELAEAGPLPQVTEPVLEAATS